jgi:hypothetical protein
MDPIGFGLENYDVAGRYREHDDGLPECTIEGKGELAPYGEFSGPGELGRLLVDEGLVERCVVEHLTAFALGRAVRADERALVDGLSTSFAESNHDFRTLIEAHVASDAFALRREPSQ